MPVSSKIKWAVCLAAAGFALAFQSGCAHHGGGSSFSSPYTDISGANVVPLTVGANNRLTTSVEVCLPGTASCQTVNDIIVDSGTSGLRLFASQVGLALVSETDVSGNPIGECQTFQNSVNWGRVVTADVALANEKAASVPVQIIADPTFAGVPVGCTGLGLVANVSSQTFGANGIIGVGALAYDCGSACVSGSGTSTLYFSCPLISGVCSEAALGLSSQVQNPVFLLPADNNGVIVSLPAVTAGGSSNMTGTLTFGIGTESNNKIAATLPVYDADTNGHLTAVFNGTTYANSTLASGMPASGILDSTALSITDCPVDGATSGFYCGSLNPALTIAGANTATPVAIPLNIANASALLVEGGGTAFDDLAGPLPGNIVWGLPFFFGRNVYIAISGQTTSVGPGPYFAF